jgi:hypothetical protein
MAALFNIVIKKKIKNSFKLYKFSIFFSKPLVVAVAKKIFQKNFVSNNFSSKSLSLVKFFRKNIFTTVKNKLHISRKRSRLLYEVEKKKQPLKTPKASLFEFKSVKKELYPLFFKNVHLKYHRKFRHA